MAILVSVKARELGTPNALAVGLQQAANRVVNARTVSRLAAGRRGASCRIYPKPLADALGVVSLIPGGRDARTMATIAVRLHRVHDGYESDGRVIPVTVIRGLSFRLAGTEKFHELKVDWHTRDARLDLCLPLATLREYPRLLVGGAR